MAEKDTFVADCLRDVGLWTLYTIAYLGFWAAVIYAVVRFVKWAWVG
jgi:hypothetical protein